jgi:alkyl hydroperoxide reductase subunit AhpC
MRNRIISVSYVGFLALLFVPLKFLAFSDRIEEFRKINTEVVACSVDSHFTHLAWINTPRKEGGLGKVQIPLLSDLNHSISKSYGVFLEDLGHTLRSILFFFKKTHIHFIFIEVCLLLMLKEF